MTNEPVHTTSMALLASSTHSIAVATLAGASAFDASVLCILDLAAEPRLDLVGANHACPFGNGPSYRSHYFAACPVGVSGFPLEAVVF